jgi:predicted transcriptional regulator
METELDRARENYEVASNELDSKEEEIDKAEEDAEEKFDVEYSELCQRRPEVAHMEIYNDPEAQALWEKHYDAVDDLKEEYEDLIPLELEAYYLYYLIKEKPSYSFDDAKVFLVLQEQNNPEFDLQLYTDLIKDFRKYK